MTNENVPKPIVCVTGASSGIGEALVRQLVAEGYVVVGLARRKEKLMELRDALPTGTFFPYECDVSDNEAVRKVYNDMSARHLLPQTIVCAAAVFMNDASPSYDHEKMKEMMSVNFFGAMNIVEAFLPDFINRTSGHFIGLSSIAAWKPSPRGIAYPASKAALAMAFRGLDLSEKNNGVRFSTIYLGPVATSMWEGKRSWIVDSPETIARKISQIIRHPKTVTYLPFLSTTLSRLSLLIPDAIYARLSTYFFK